MRLSTPYVIAHRGFHAEVPQNTLAAFEAAIELGADMVELDVQETADGELVVYHDETVCGTPLNRLSYKELRAQLSDPLAPRFSDALGLFGDSVGLDVEIKHGTPDRIAAHLRKVGCEHVVTSFDALALRAYREAAPAARCGLIVEASYGAPSASAKSTVLKAATSARPDFLVLEKPLISEDLLHAISGLLDPPFVWTVNDEPTIEELLANPAVGGVITDRPDFAVAVRAKFRAFPPSHL